MRRLYFDRNFEKGTLVLPHFISKRISKNVQKGQSIVDYLRTVCICARHVAPTCGRATPTWQTRRLCLTPVTPVRTEQQLATAHPSIATRQHPWRAKQLPWRAIGAAASTHDCNYGEVGVKLVADEMHAKSEPPPPRARQECV